MNSSGKARDEEEIVKWWEGGEEGEREGGPIGPLPRGEGEDKGGAGGEGERRGRGEGGGPLERLDLMGDRVLAVLTGTQPRVKRGIVKGVKEFLARGKGSLERLDKLEEEYSQRVGGLSPTEKVMELILRYPKTIIALTLVFSIILFAVGAVGTENLKSFAKERKLRLRENIRADFEVYLPQNDPTGKVLEEMREDFSTDLIIIYVETYNRYDPVDVTNVTNVDVLNEMSAIEEALNFNKTDRGAEDGIIFVLSISTIIKYLNSTPETISQAVENELKGGLLERFNPLNEWNYSIPNQTTVDQLFRRIPPSTLNSIVADSNGDGIYDSTLIMIGLSQKADRKAILNKLYSMLKPYEVEMTVDGPEKESMERWKERYERGEVHTVMTPTGPTPMMETISGRTYSEMERVVPLALVFVFIALFAFHRTWKIIAITMVPILTTLLIIFGILGITNWVLTPQVVLIAPVLIALGVAYGIYIANRYAEESQIKDKEERIRRAVKTTGRAIFLSATTTAFGFASLMTVNMVPMRVLGFGLSVGIMVSWAVTMLTVPSLVRALDYQKKVESKQWERLGKMVVRNRRRFLAGAIAVLIFSVVILSTSIVVNMDYMAMSPPDEPVILKMREQSEVFNSGQMNLLLIRCAPPRDTDGDGRDDILTDSMKDLSILDRIDALESRVNGEAGVEGIENATAISVVDILKMVEVPDFTNNSAYQEVMDRIREVNETLANYIETLVSSLVGRSFWVALHKIPQDLYLPFPVQENLYTFMINVFYNSLGPEFSSMLVKEDYSKSVMYVMMPNMDVVATEKVVNEVNRAIEETKPGISATELSGFGPVLVAINNLLLENSVLSTAISYFSVLLLLYVFYRNRKIAMITTIPIIFIIFWQYPVIWFLGKLGGWINPTDPPFTGELNLFTAIIGSIMIGIGIDFSIHITERMREKRFRAEVGVPYAASTSGMAFIEATVTMLMGLMAVMAVNIPSIREFILLIMILLVIAAYSAIFVLGSVYYIVLGKKRRGGVRVEGGER